MEIFGHQFQLELIAHPIDLMGLMNENQTNLIPYTPGIGNYVVLRFGDITGFRSPHLPPRDFYMVIFKYGSTVMFNMLDHEVDGCLKIINIHTSGMPPKTSKDGGDSSQKYMGEFGEGMATLITVCYLNSSCLGTWECCGRLL